MNRFDTYTCMYIFIGRQLSFCQIFDILDYKPFFVILPPLHQPLNTLNTYPKKEISEISLFSIYMTKKNSKKKQFD